MNSSAHGAFGVAMMEGMQSNVPPAGRSERLARAFDQLNIFLHPFAAGGRSVGDRQLKPPVAELEVLLDVVAGTVSRNPLLGLAAEQLVHRHSERIADHVPKREIDA